MFAIGVFGVSGAGKRRCLSKLAATALQDASRATIGVEFYAMSRSLDSASVKLDVSVFNWEERFKHLIPSYCALKEGFVFLIDVTKGSSLDYVDEWLAACKESTTSSERAPIVLFGNKTDLSHRLEVSKEQAIEIVKSKGLNEYFEISCKSGSNIEKAFNALSRMLIRRHCYDKI